MEDAMTQTAIDAIGFMAAGMTISAFWCRGMIMLRSAALSANLLFILYGGLLGLMPVLLLHLMLLPLNAMRLAECLRARAARPAVPDCEPAGGRAS
jgi:hypothetical protein